MAALLKSAVSVYICGTSPSAAERTQREKFKVIYVHIIFSLIHTLSVQVAMQEFGEKSTAFNSFLLERYWTSV